MPLTPEIMMPIPIATSLALDITKAQGQGSQTHTGENHHQQHYT
jgi:hypothetical protein